MTAVKETSDLARAAADVRDVLHRRGKALAARDAFVAGAAKSLDERLAVSDSDFAVERLADLLDVDLL